MPAVTPAPILEKARETLIPTHLRKPEGVVIIVAGKNLVRSCARDCHLESLSMNSLR